MQSDSFSTALALDYYSQLLPSLQQPPPLQPLTSSSYSLTQQPSLQHTMSVADPFSPSWPLFNPPSPAARKQSGAAFGGSNAGWLENAQQLLPTVSSAGLSMGGINVQSQLSQLNANLLQQQQQQQQQRASQQAAAVPLNSLPQQPSSVFHPLPQRAVVSSASQMMQPSPLMSPPPLQQPLSLPTTITAQQLNQLRAMQQMQHQQQQQQQQQTGYSPQRVQSMTGLAPMQPFSSPTLPTQSLSNSLSFLQSFRSGVSAPASTSLPAAKQSAASGTVELATSLLSYLSSVELQRGLLYVNRLWRFKSLYVLQSRQVNVQVQLTHLYLGPFRASNMLELVFSLQVRQRLVNSGTTNTGNASGSNNNSLQSPVQPLRPLQLPKSVPSSPASVTRTPLMSAVAPTVLNSPSTIARATVCTAHGSVGRRQSQGAVQGRRAAGLSLGDAQWWQAS